MAFARNRVVSVSLLVVVLASGFAGVVASGRVECDATLSEPQGVCGVFPVWPMPRYASLTSNGAVAVDSSNFTFVNEAPAIAQAFVDKAINYTRGRMFLEQPWTMPYRRSVVQTRARLAVADSVLIASLTVRVESAQVDKMEVGMDESYQLDVDTHGAVLSAATVFGALRGLAVFEQLVQWSGQEFAVPHAPLLIRDRPRYPWRGLLLDTSRHFYPITDIRRTIDAMYLNKLNVLHWHIVDADSFPFASDRYPELGMKGAFAPALVYTPRQIRSLVRYAYHRGIIIVPELDVPGHTASWSVSHPDLVIPCWHGTGSIQDGVLDMTRDATYDMVFALLDELAALFPDHYVHVGGDEVNLDCLSGHEHIQEYMREHSFASAADLYIAFEHRVVAHVAKAEMKAVLWAEAPVAAAAAGKPLPAQNVLIQPWLEARHVPALLSHGYSIINSVGWYLDHTWKRFPDYYQVDIDTLAGPSVPADVSQNLVKGGEMCSWSEFANTHNLDTRIWQFGPAVAERLWSPKPVRNVMDAEARLGVFHCFLARRGIAVAPTYADYCDTASLRTSPPSDSGMEPGDESQAMWIGVLNLLLSLLLGFVFCCGPGLSGLTSDKKQTSEPQPPSASQPASASHHVKSD